MYEEGGGADRRIREKITISLKGRVAVFYQYAPPPPPPPRVQNFQVIPAAQAKRGGIPIPRQSVGQSVRGVQSFRH